MCLAEAVPCVIFRHASVGAAVSCKNTSLNLTRGIIVDMMTPEAMMNAAICGVAFGTEEIRERVIVAPVEIQ